MRKNCRNIFLLAHFCTRSFFYSHNFRNCSLFTYFLLAMFLLSVCPNNLLIAHFYVRQFLHAERFNCTFYSHIISPRALFLLAHFATHIVFFYPFCSRTVVLFAYFLLIHFSARIFFNYLRVSYWCICPLAHFVLRT